MSDATRVGPSDDCLGESLQQVIDKISPIVSYMMNIVIFPDEEKNKVRLFVGTKTAKRDVEMLLPDDVKDKVSVEVAPET